MCAKWNTARKRQVKAELREEQTAGRRRSKGSWRSPVGELFRAGRWCRRAVCECVGGRIVSLYTLREPHRPYFCCRHHLLCCCPWIFQGGITHRHRGCIWNRSTKWAPGATSGPVPSSHSLGLYACPADQSLFLLYCITGSQLVSRLLSLPQAVIQCSIKLVYCTKMFLYSNIESYLCIY